MALIDDVNKGIENIGKLAENGVPISVEHKFDLPSVSYTALVAFAVVVAAIVLTGVKDVIVHRITR